MITDILKMLLLLLSYWISTGVMAEEPPATRYQLQNSSVCLHVKKPPPYDNAAWMLNEKLIANANLNFYDAKKGNFSPESLTLCLKKLTENDTGIYKVFYFSNKISTTEAYHLIIQEMVPRPVMVVMPENRSNLSAAACRFTVNCSIQDDQLLSFCDKDVCSPSEKSFRDFNMTIVSDNTAVVCIGNNYVSTNNVSESYTTWCYSKYDPELIEESKPRFKIELIIIILCAMILFICAVLSFIHFSKKHQQQTAAAPLIQSGPLDTQPRTEPRTSTSSSCEADPSYENVDIDQPGGISSIPRGEQGSRHNQGVDTVYSIPTAPASHAKYESSKNRAGHTDGKTASALETAADVQEQGCEQTETVYTLLQMPKHSQPPPEET